ncbi:hypothetical protein VSS74_30290 [Conexibacter stalactiti]|uniref:Uncharacterized protein n=1 Tax=Conexibacter stalactiti TaxID=1940611 RepID=A0ABU4HZH4_9ACTN|nr:hypothetical protein [Conexibacter stalactiti]MDW5598690.1 hypothetical protein [Conexibacter stalactiti]MEC5039332.1 hypothetical protein [Conexibacter stalactiti]
MTGVAALAVAAAAPAAGAQDLFVQQAAGGTLNGATLVLRGVAPRITSFADRPQRSAGTESLAAFVKRWPASFRGDPPNAALEIDGAPAGRDVAIVELRKPRYDAKARTLTFAVRRLGARAVAKGGLARFGNRADSGGKGTTRFGRATLFVDPGADTEFGLLTFQAPAASAISITLDNGTFAPTYGNGLFITNLNTPALQGTPSNPYSTTSVASARVQPRGISFTTSNGGAGLTLDVIIGIELPAGGGPLTGTATVPGGGRLQIGWDSGNLQTLSNGAFTLQPPS